MGEFADKAAGAANEADRQGQARASARRSTGRIITAEGDAQEAKGDLQSAKGNVKGVINKL